MTVNEEAVTWAYRLFLDRDPESREAIATHMQSQDLATLRRGFIESQEFLRQPFAPLTTGRHAGFSAPPTDISASPDETAAMLTQIAREWRKFGEMEPHWSVLVADRFSSANIQANVDAFYETGFHNLPLILNPLRRSGIVTERFGRVLDFGCGVGRLTLALATVANEVVGIDISPAHLSHAKARAADKEITNVEFRSIDRVEDLDGESGYDLIVSLIVLQHNPPPVMAAILQRLLAALRPGGCAVIQIPTLIFDYSFKTADYLANAQQAMEMNALPQRDIFRTADELGARMLEVQEDTWIGAVPGTSHTFVFQKR